ncbi:MAG: agmatine deiminase family protein [Chitinivibrionales bacterium]|nr:agmatine deiminase family protein [Chitinivibrionales bacterium]
MRRSSALLLTAALFCIGFTVSDGLSQQTQEKDFMVFDEGYTPDAWSSTPYRMAAEWEPTAGTLISYPLLIPHELTVELAKDDTLYVLVPDSAKKTEAESAFKSWGVNLKHVRWLPVDAGPGAPWTRDWGPFCLFDSSRHFLLGDADFRDDPLSCLYPISINGKKMTIAVQDSGHLASVWDYIIDYEYDTITVALRVAQPQEKKNWSYKDSLAWYASFVEGGPVEDYTEPTEIARLLGIKSHPISVAITGGNALVDGHGTVFSNRIMFNENYLTLGLTPAEVISRVRKELGVRRYLYIPYYEDFGIQHIDCIMKIIDEETIVIARPPQHHPLYKTYCSIADFFASQKSVFGRTYTVIPIETPAYRFDFVPAYTNGLILNKKVLVPLFGISQDSAALRTFRAAMPGYTVIGIPSGDSPKPWKWYDALHCRVKGIADPAMLHLSHKRLDRTMKKTASLPLQVRITDYSRMGVQNESVKAYWRIHGQAQWQVLGLRQKEKIPAVFSASLNVTQMKSGQSLEYYIEAFSNSGRKERLPRTAPLGCYSVLMHD